jgi:hypothetical protein
MYIIGTLSQGRAAERIRSSSPVGHVRHAAARAIRCDWQFGNLSASVVEAACWSACSRVSPRQDAVVVSAVRGPEVAPEDAAGAVVAERRELGHD